MVGPIYVHNFANGVSDRGLGEPDFWLFVRSASQFHAPPRFFVGDDSHENSADSQLQLGYYRN
jgi:hypothetical protein